MGPKTDRRRRRISVALALLVGTFLVALPLTYFILQDLELFFWSRPLNVSSISHQHSETTGSTAEYTTRYFLPTGIFLSNRTSISSVPIESNETVVLQNAITRNLSKALGLDIPQLSPESNFNTDCSTSDCSTPTFQLTPLNQSNIATISSQLVTASSKTELPTVTSKPETSTSRPGNFASIAITSTSKPEDLTAISYNLSLNLKHFASKPKIITSSKNLTESLFNHAKITLQEFVSEGTEELQKEKEASEKKADINFKNLVKAKKPPSIRASTVQAITLDKAYTIEELAKTTVRPTLASTHGSKFVPESKQPFSSRLFPASPNSELKTSKNVSTLAINDKQQTKSDSIKNGQEPKLFLLKDKYSSQSQTKSRPIESSHINVSNSSTSTQSYVPKQSSTQTGIRESSESLVRPEKTKNEEFPAGKPNQEDSSFQMQKNDFRKLFANQHTVRPYSLFPVSESNFVPSNRIDDIEPREFPNHHFTSKPPEKQTVPTTVSIRHPQLHHSHRHDHYDFASAVVVTALFDIGRGEWYKYTRSYDQYLEYLQKILLMKNRLVIYTDHKGANFVREKRHSKNTEIYEMTLQHLPLYRYRDEMKEIIDHEQNDWRFDDAMKDHPESKSVDYDLLVNSKAFFLYNATKSSRFRHHAKYFAWVDAGYGHANQSVVPAYCHWKPALPNGFITVIKITPEYDKLERYSIKDLYRVDWTVISGGFLGGDVETIGRFYRFYHKVFLDLLDDKKIDDDQTTLTMVMKQYSNLFYTLHSDGDWFSLFKFFPC